MRPFSPAFKSVRLIASLTTAHSVLGMFFHIWACFSIYDLTECPFSFVPAICLLSSYLSPFGT